MVYRRLSLFITVHKMRICIFKLRRLSVHVFSHRQLAVNCSLYYRRFETSRHLGRFAQPQLHAVGSAPGGKRRPYETLMVALRCRGGGGGVGIAVVMLSSTTLTHLRHV